MSGGVTPPPIFTEMVGDDGKATLLWIAFFNSLFNGDTGQAWSPSFTSLSHTGAAPSITGIVYRVGRSLAYFRVTVTPGTDTSAVAGTTTIDNFPLALQADAACLAVAGTSGGGSGVCSKSDGKIYVPAWTTVSVPVTITGLVEAK